MAVRKIMIVAGLVVLAACVRSEPRFAWQASQKGLMPMEQAFAECEFEKVKIHGFDWIDRALRRAEVLAPCMKARGFYRTPIPKFIPPN